MSSSNPEERTRKHFIPLESNPEVFTELVHKLGISQSLEFHDVFSIDEPDLLAFIPRPALALVLVFPATEAYEKRCANFEAEAGDYEGSGDDEPFVFYKQSIHNACGLYAILHAVSNGEARKRIAEDSIMARLLKDSIPRKPHERALVLEDSEELETTYAYVAKKGDTEAPAAEDEVDFHYICYVKSDKNSHLYSMDGDRKRPTDLGELGADDDVLSEKCLDIIRDLIKDSGSLNFSLMVLAPAME